MIRKYNLPTSLDWKKILVKIPEEKVEVDKNGHYCLKKNSDFYDWMING